MFLPNSDSFTCASPEERFAPVLGFSSFALQMTGSDVFFSHPTSILLTNADILMWFLRAHPDDKTIWSVAMDGSNSI